MARSECCSCPPRLPIPRDLPRGGHGRCQPHRNVTAFDKRSVVRWPVSDAVCRLVLQMHSRLPVEILPSWRHDGQGIDGSRRERRNVE